MVPGIVLAAGQSSRMGRPKALLPLGRETFLSRVVGALRQGGVEDVVVVTGGDRDAVAAAVRAWPDPPRLVHNSRYEEGQLSSLIAALQVVDRPGVRAVLVTLVDVPLVSSETVRRVLDAYRRTHAPVVRPVRGTRHGHPVVFDRAIFEALRHADPAQGAQAVVHAHANDIVDVPIDDEGPFLDVDTPEDYERLTARFGSGT